MTRQLFNEAIKEFSECELEGLLTSINVDIEGLDVPGMIQVVHETYSDEQVASLTYHQVFGTTNRKMATLVALGGR